MPGPSSRRPPPSTAPGAPRAPRAGGSVVKHATDETFAAIVAESEVPVVVDLWAPWCAPCVALAPRLEEVAARLAGRIRVIKVDVDENPALADRFAVLSIPMLVFLRGAQQASLVGLQPTRELQAWVRACLEGPAAPVAAAPRPRGRPPTLDQIMAALRRIPEVTSVAKGRRVVIRVPRADVEVTLAARDVLQLHRVEDPWGDPAVALLVSARGQPRQAVVSKHDFVFEPDPSATGLEQLGAVPVDVRGLPPVVGYTEMMRELAGASAALAAERDLSTCFGTLVRLRYFINGARRVGVDCRAAFAAWEQLRDALQRR